MNKDLESKLMTFDGGYETEDCQGCEDCDCYEEGETNNVELKDAGDILAAIRARASGWTAPEPEPLNPTSDDDILSNIRSRTYKDAHQNEKPSLTLDDLRKAFESEEK